MDVTAVAEAVAAKVARAIPADMKVRLKIPYALRRIPAEDLSTWLPVPSAPEAGDVVLCRVETIGRNTALDLAGGRRSTLHPGDLICVAFGNRYATRQFEAYARADGEACDLFSIGGLCGRVESKHESVADPTKLRLLGAVGDASGRPLRLRDFGLPPVPTSAHPRVVAVCGSSMDAGKTHTLMSVIIGLRQAGVPVAGIKLTGTATGRDTWTAADAGACVALDFTDGGFPSTYLCPLEDLLALYKLLLGHAARAGARWAVVEIADGLLQGETTALLRSTRFRETVSAWLFATGDPLAAVGGVSLLRSWAIEPLAISGIVSMSPLGAQEVRKGTGLPCLTAAELQAGTLNAQLLGRGQGVA